MCHYKHLTGVCWSFEQFAKIQKRRRYDEEFKRRAVRLSYGSERTIAEAAESLGIHRSLLTRWRRESIRISGMSLNCTENKRGTSIYGCE